jgi:hypothetical protein
VEEIPANATVTTTTTPVTSQVPTTTPGQTPAPAEMAYLSGIACAVGDRSEDAYHCNGNVRISRGFYDEVQVIARYADNNTFKSGIVSLGGNGPVSQPFFLFPDPKYQGQTPAYFVRLDSTVNPVVWSGNGGTAWSNLPADKQF